MAATRFIFIAGPSGSGKTTVAEKILMQFPNRRCCIIKIDDYYQRQDAVPLHERALKNYDDPITVDLQLLRSQILKLKLGQAIEKPIYDFKTHNRLAATEIIDPKKYDLFIIEGIFALQPLICQLADISVYMHTDYKICFQRRLTRDQKERGRSKEDITRQFQTQVFPMFLQHVWPTRLNAKCLIFNNGMNQDINLTDLFEQIEKMYMQTKNTKSVALFYHAPQANTPELPREQLHL